MALLRQPQLADQLRADPGLAEALVQEVCRFDPAVQNTRRFVTRACRIAGISLDAGDTILLLLAAAGRDAQANPSPNEFILQRSARRLFGFGQGRHACPGQGLASTIATAALQATLAMAWHVAPHPLEWTYRPSANARLPQFSRSKIPSPKAEL